MAQEYDDGSKDIAVNQKEHTKKTTEILRAGENSIGDFSSILDKMQSMGLIDKENDKEVLAKIGLSEEKIAEMSKNAEMKKVDEKEMDEGR